jgi:outer membrane protein TolC
VQIVRLRRLGRLAACGVILIPACSAIDTESATDPSTVQPPSIVSAPPAAPGTRPVAAQTSTDADQPAATEGFAATQADVRSEAPASRPLPINLPTALTLANAQPIDVVAAAERVRVAAARLELARVQWLPTVTVGGDYNRHTGKIQNADGTITDTSRSSAMFGVGTGIGNAAILNVNDAIFAPLVARQTVRAREADFRAAQNDSTVAVTDAYFAVQQARGELAGAAEATRRMEDLVERTRKLAAGLVPELEATRAEAELARRQQVEELARERWRVCGAELVRLLRLDPTSQVDPIEPPDLRVDLIDPSRTVDDLIPIALTGRPELSSRQAQVQATLAMLHQERLRPLVPSVLLRGWSTPVTGTLAAGVFAGSQDGRPNSSGTRTDVDLQLLWQFDNLGFGNRAMTHQREAENRLALVELFRVQDQVAADVAQAYARTQEAAKRVAIAERGLRLAGESADRNLVALGQVRRVGDVNELVVRPLEAVTAVQVLAQAYVDYYAAVADHNRAQFQLYRALGHPAACLAAATSPPSTLPATRVPALVPLAPANMPQPAPCLPAARMLGPTSISPN